MNILKLTTLLLALLGAPLFLVIAALALISFASVDIDLSVVIIEMSRLAETPLLVSLPLFILLAPCSQKAELLSGFSCFPVSFCIGCRAAWL